MGSMVGKQVEAVDSDIKGVVVGFRGGWAVVMGAFGRIDEIQPERLSVLQ